MSDGLRRAQEFALVSALTAVAFMLGVVGFMVTAGPTASTRDLWYLSLQLFVLQSGVVNGPVPWTLEIARFLAPGVAAYATFRVLGDVLRDRVDIVSAAFVRNHTIVCGTSDMAVLLARRLCEQHVRVVVVDVDPAPAVVLILRHAGALVINADSSDTNTLKRAGLARANRLVIASGTDSEAAGVAAAVRTLKPTERAADLVCFVAVGQVRLCQLLRAHTVMTSDTGSLRFEFINLIERAAHALLQEHPPARGTGGSVVVLGVGALADEIATQIQALGEPPALTVRLAAGQPAPADAIAIYVCLDDEDEAWDAALTIHGEVAANVSIVVVQDRTSGLGDLLASGSERAAYRNVHVFSVLDRTCRPEILLREVYEAMAESFHQRYVEQCRQTGADADNPSAVPWENLPETLRQANRQQAMGIGAALDRLGLSIVPATAGSAPLTLMKAEVDELAKAEHDRWRKERESGGWTPGQKEIESKTNPHLKDWKALDATVQAFDHQAMQALPEILAAQGLAIVRRSKP